MKKFKEYLLETLDKPYKLKDDTVRYGDLAHFKKQGNISEALKKDKQ